MASVSKAVILAAGMGTRMLPATKAVPKEMLPVVDKPLIQYAVEECAAAGIDHVVFVIAPGREAVREHFGTASRAEATARARGDSAALALIEGPSRLARFDYVLQEQPLGIANAVQRAREFVEGQPFALLFPDDFIIAREPVVGQLARAYGRGDGSVVAVMPVAPEDVPQYGIVDPAGDGNPVRLRAIVEKPSAADAPSRLGVVGRYILGPTIFRHIERLKPGAGGELQITDAIASQIAAGEAVSAYAFEGQRYDTGRPLGLLVAGIAAALARADLRPALLERLAPLLETRPH